jgi:hypothetical protein
MYSDGTETRLRATDRPRWQQLLCTEDTYGDAPSTYTKLDRLDALRRFVRHKLGFLVPPLLKQKTMTVFSGLMYRGHTRSHSQRESLIQLRGTADTR